MPGQSVARSVHCHPSLRSEVVEGTNHLDSGAGDLLFLTSSQAEEQQIPRVRAADARDDSRGTG